jgi:flagellar biosynthesis protein FlhA
VLQRLLRERIPIRDLVSILESVGDHIDQTKDAEVLTEHARRALSNVIARLYADNQGVIRGLTLGPRLETALAGLLSPRATSSAMPLSPDALADLLRDLHRLATTHAIDGRMPPLVVPPSLRVGLRRLLEPVIGALPVVSLAEFPPAVQLNSIASWELHHA